MKINYREFKEDQQNKFNALPIKFAFTNKRLEEIKQEWNCTDDDLIRVSGGGFMLRKNRWMLEEWDKTYEAEWHELKTDMDFMRDAFRYELANNEYCITYDDDDVLDSLGITYEDLLNDTDLNLAYMSAKDEYLEEIDY